MTSEVTDPDADLVEHGDLRLERSISRRTVVEMLLGGPPHRLTTLGYLLDATTVAVAGGLPVALVADDPDDAAVWVTAVSYFSGPDISALLAGVGSARLADLAPGCARAPLNLVPAVDLPPTSTPSGLSAQVVEIDHEVRRGDGPAGTFWENRFGQRVPVTEWSTLALEACSYGTSGLLGRLTELARICRMVEPEIPPGPLWPLAVVHLLRPASRECRRLAARVVLRDTHPDTPLPEGLLRPLGPTFVECLGSRAEDVWALLRYANRGAEAEDPAADPAADPAEDLAGAPAADHVEDPADHVEDPADDPAEHPAEHPADGQGEHPAEGGAEGATDPDLAPADGERTASGAETVDLTAADAEVDPVDGTAGTDAGTEGTAGTAGTDAGMPTVPDAAEDAPAGDESGTAATAATEPADRELVLDLDAVTGTSGTEQDPEPPRTGPGVQDPPAAPVASVASVAQVTQVTQVVPAAPAAPPVSAALRSSSRLGLPGGSRIVEMALVRYVELAVRDEAWLLRPGGIPLPRPVPVSREVSPRLRGFGQAALLRLMDGDTPTVLVPPRIGTVRSRSATPEEVPDQVPEDLRSRASRGSEKPGDLGEGDAPVADAPAPDGTAAVPAGHAPAAAEPSTGSPASPTSTATPTPTTTSTPATPTATPAATASADAPEIRRAARALRLVDLLVRMESVVRGAVVSLKDAMSAVEQVADLLLGPRGPEVVPLVGELDERTLTYLVWPVIRRRLDRLPGLPGSRLDLTLLELLVPDADLHRLSLRLEPGPERDPVLAEAVVARCMRTPESDLELRVGAALTLLRPEVEWPRDRTSQECAREALTLVRGWRPWRAEELRRLVEGAGQALDVGLARYLMDVLLDVPATEEGCITLALLRQARGVVRGEGDLPVLTDAENAMLDVMAHVGPGWYLAEEGFPERAIDILGIAASVWDRLAAQDRPRVGAHLLVAGLQVALASAGEPAPGVAGPLRARCPRQPAALVTVVQGAVGVGLEAALPLFAELLGGSGYPTFRNALTRHCLREVLDGVRSPSSLTRAELPIDLAARLRAREVGQAVLRYGLRDLPRPQVQELFTEVVQGLAGSGRSPGMTQRMGLRRWWRQVTR